MDDFVRHIAHAVDVVGADHVGLGMDFVEDLFTQVDPVLSGALVDPVLSGALVDPVLSGALVEPAHLPTVPGLQRPADLDALGPRIVARLGEDAARRVAADTMIERLGELLP